MSFGEKEFEVLFGIAGDHNPNIYISIDVAESLGIDLKSKVCYVHTPRDGNKGGFITLTLLPADAEVKTRRARINKKGHIARIELQAFHCNAIDTQKVKAVFAANRKDIVITTPLGLKKYDGITYADEKKKPAPEKSAALKKKRAPKKQLRDEEPELLELTEDQLLAMQEIINSLSLTGLGQRVLDYLEARGFDDPQAAIDDLRKAVF